MATLTAPAGSRKKLPVIDMTPMVDLAFLLLTFFVLTTSLSEPFALKLVMPHKPGSTTPQPPINGKRVLTLVLGEQNKIHWYVGQANRKAETTDFSGAGIRKVLIEKKNSIKDLYVLIKPSAQSQYANVIDILDEMIITGINRYAIVEMETPDKQLVAMK
ncbi:MAG TPA: biopolymer transporter ExbD [Cyclobacteriaceae bacterium]|nr:biopolymer transporter ExbD [Cyclobacteriaceae bacterium]